MRAIVILLGLLIFCALCFNVAALLSPDAVGIAVGMLFGVLSGIPTALIMMAGDRRRADDEDDYLGAAYPHPPPVVTVHPPRHDALPPSHVDHPALPAGYRQIATPIADLYE